MRKLGDHILCLDGAGGQSGQEVASVPPTNPSRLPIFYAWRGYLSTTSRHEKTPPEEATRQAGQSRWRTRATNSSRHGFSRVRSSPTSTSMIPNNRRSGKGLIALTDDGHQPYDGRMGRYPFYLDLSDRDVRDVLWLLASRWEEFRPADTEIVCLLWSLCDKDLRRLTRDAQSALGPCGPFRGNPPLWRYFALPILP